MRRQINIASSAIFLGVFAATILWLIWNLVPWLSWFPVGYDSPRYVGIPLGFLIGVAMNVFLNLRFQWACAGVRVGAIVLLVCTVCAIATFTKMQESTDWESAGWWARYYVSKVGIVSALSLLLAGVFSHLAFRSQSKNPRRLPNDQRAEQDGSGNGGYRPSFASLWTSILRRATPLICKK